MFFDCNFSVYETLKFNFWFFEKSFDFNVWQFLLNKILVKETYFDTFTLIKFYFNKLFSFFFYKIQSKKIISQMKIQNEVILIHNKNF